MKQQFDFGEEVRVIRAIRNDGTMHGYARGELLVRRGSTGYVREWGTFLIDQIIYQIHFLDSDLIVGCREQELLPITAPWYAGQFQYGDRVLSRHALAINGKVVVEPGVHGEITATGQGENEESYTVTFNQRWFQVPADALISLENE